MNIYKVIKENVTAKDIAEFFELDKSGKLYRCPFHNDRNPSMQVDERYYCHGCGATGDAIDLVCKLCDMKPYEAAKYIAEVFNIDTDNVSIVERTVKVKALKNEKDETISELINYEKSLDELIKIFAPKSDDDNPSQAFLCAIKEKEILNYLFERFYQNPTGDETRELINESNKLMEEKYDG